MKIKPDDNTQFTLPNSIESFPCAGEFTNIYIDILAAKISDRPRNKIKNFLAGNMIFGEKFFRGRRQLNAPFHSILYNDPIRLSASAQRSAISLFDVALFCFRNSRQNKRAESHKLCTYRFPDIMSDN